MLRSTLFIFLSTFLISNSLFVELIDRFGTENKIIINILFYSALTVSILFTIRTFKYINKNTIKKHKIEKKIKNILYQLIKNTGFLIPHLRNHHIILAKKINNVEEIIQKRKVTTSMQEWLEIRKDALGY